MLTHKHIIFSQTDQYNKEYTITEPEDVSADNIIHTPTKDKKPKQKKTPSNQFEQIDETVELVEADLGESKDSIKKKRKVKVDQDKLVDDVVEKSTVDEKEPPIVAKRDKPKKKKVVKSKQDDMDEYIQFLIHQEIPKTVLSPYVRTEMELPQRARRDSSIKPMKLTAMKIEKMEVKKPKLIQISSVAEFPQMLKLKTPKQRPQEEKKRRSSEASFKNKKLKSVIRFIPYSPYCFPYTVIELEPNRDNGELSRNIEEAEEVLKFKPKKFKHTKPVKAELEEPNLESIDDDTQAKDEEQDKPKYKRSKKNKEETEDQSRKLKIGKGKIPQTVEEMETVELKPFKLDSESEEISEIPKISEGKEKKDKKPKESDDKLGFKPFVIEDDKEEGDEKQLFKYQVIELESEEKPEEQEKVTMHLRRSVS